MRRDKPTPSVRLDEHFALDLCKSRVRGLKLFLFLAHRRTALAIRRGKLGLVKASEAKAIPLHNTSWVVSRMALSWSRMLTGVSNYLQFRVLHPSLILRLVCTAPLSNLLAHPNRNFSNSIRPVTPF
jgi:hypothetical protein